MQSEPVTELIAMIDAATREEGCLAFDHTPEELGLHVMENCEAIRAALTRPATDAAPDGLVDDIAAAMQWSYCAGAEAVHEHYTDDAYPEFDEAASDTVKQSDALEGLSARITADAAEKAELELALVEADRKSDALNAEWNDALSQLAEREVTIAGLREALELADCALRGANMNMSVVERKIVAALRTVDGEAG